MQGWLWRRAVGVLGRGVSSRLGKTLLWQQGLAQATQTAGSLAKRAMTQAQSQQFTISLPATIYVRASHCNVYVSHQAGNTVQLSSTLSAAFGWEFAAEQDAEGIYIVAKRKPVVGQLSYGELHLVVPPAVHLAFHLTPGQVSLALDGHLSWPGHA
jgi:hypothetical protein